MSAEQSEEMMELLKELAMLKKMDKKEGGGSSEDAAELESREKRRREITDQIKVLGEGTA
jgi:hypothetical protein